MNNFSPARKIIDSLVEYRKWWLAPTLVCTVLATGYALFSEKSYTSRQSLIVRDDLVGTSYKPGRFDSLDSMKSAQETILEISRRPQVVRAAMKRLGPPGRMSEANWLGDENLESMQGKIQISAPNGAEFGRTEAIVLAVNQNSRERAGQFVSYLLDEMEDSLRNLRSAKFSSMQQELEQATALAEKSYLNAADELKLFEQKIGLDLSTLISLNDSQAGTNNLQSDLANLSIEKRTAWSEMEKVRKQIQILTNIAERPESILEVPQELLQLQPTLTSLAQGLNEADLAFSKSRGRYQAQHPKVREAYREIVDIKDRIKAKLTRSLGSLSYQLESRQDKYERISQLVNEKQSRLGDLSSMRVDYTTLRQGVDKKREIYAKAQASLSEIATLGTSAKKVSLISRIHEPQTELYPDGPSNKAVVFGGMIAGLMIGMGLVMFVTPIGDPEAPSPNTNRTAAKPNRDSRSQGRPGGPQPPATETVPKPSSAPVAQQNSAPAANSISGAILQQQREKSNVRLGANTSSSDDAKVAQAAPKRSMTPIGAVAEPEEQPMVEESKPNETIESPIEESTFVEFDATHQPQKDVSGEFEQALQSEPKTVAPTASTSSGPQEQIVSSEVSQFESDFNSKSAAEIAAEITGSISANESVQQSITTEASRVVQRDEFFSGGTDESDDNASDFSSLIKQAQTAAEDFAGTDSDVNASNTAVRHETASAQMNTEIDIPRVEAVPHEDVATSAPIVEASEAEFKTPALPVSPFESISETISQTASQTEVNDNNDVPFPNGGGLEALTETDDGTPADASSGNVFHTLYEDGAAQILESADFSSADPGCEEFDLSSLRIGKEDHRILSEKLDQLGQSELESEDAGKTPVSSIDPNAVVNSTDQAGESPSAIQAGEPLTTSIESSSFATEGYESGPLSGQQPDNRPTATTVDLRMLKQQLAGSRRDTEDSKPLSQLIDKGVHESDVAAPEEKPVDQSIADLANSIREICQNKDQEPN